MKKSIYTTIALCLFILLFSFDNRERNNIIISENKIDSVKNMEQATDLFAAQTIKTYSSYVSRYNRFYDYRTNGFNNLVTLYSYKEDNVCVSAAYVGANLILSQ